MENGRSRFVHASVLLTLVATGSFACRGSPSAVERLENAPGPLVTILGSIEVGTRGSPGEIPEMFLRFYAPPDTAMVAERQMLFAPQYRLEFMEDAVCGWSFDVTIWDGRRSERKPVSGGDAPCEGFVDGPDFWFP